MKTNLLCAFAIGISLIISQPVAAQDVKRSYPAMAPVDQYLMNRTAEIALARFRRSDGRTERNMLR
jgi:hypothetical protein